MGNAVYRVKPVKSGWFVEHDGRMLGPYTTKDIALGARRSRDHHHRARE